MGLFGGGNRSSKTQNFTTTTNVGFNDVAGPAVYGSMNRIEVTDQGATNEAGKTSRTALAENRRLTETAMREGTAQFREAASTLRTGQREANNLTRTALGAVERSGRDALGFGRDAMLKVSAANTAALGTSERVTGKALNVVENLSGKSLNLASTMNSASLGSVERISRNAMGAIERTNSNMLTKGIDLISKTNTKFTESVQRLAAGNSAANDERILTMGKWLLGSAVVFGGLVTWVKSKG